jgi:hypothetical protein
MKAPLIEEQLTVGVPGQYVENRHSANPSLCMAVSMLVSTVYRFPTDHYQILCLARNFNE